MGLKVRGWSFGLKISGLKCPAIIIQAGFEHLLENSVMIPKNQRKDSDFHISYINLDTVLLGSKSWKNVKFSNELNDNEKKNIDDYFYPMKKLIKIDFSQNLNTIYDLICANIVEIGWWFILE